MKLRHEHAILILALALVVIGLGMVFSASHEIARAKFGDAFFFVKRQMVRAIIGVVLLLVASQIDYRQWRRFARLGLVVACVGLGVVFLFQSIRAVHHLKSRLQ